MYSDFFYPLQIILRTAVSRCLTFQRSYSVSSGGCPEIIPCVADSLFSDAGAAVLSAYLNDVLCFYVESRSAL
jgi:hypothetical protein